MTSWKRVLVVTVTAVAPLAAAAEERVLTLQPEKTSVMFTVNATGHDVGGVPALDSGQIRFHPTTGAASGLVTIDLRRADTGNRLRDREMRTSMLETERYPLAVFHASRLRGSIAPSGWTDIVIGGTILMHGIEHPLAVPVKVKRSGDSVSAEAVFGIPYVAWGLSNPSFLFLRVAPVAEVTVKTEGSLRQEGRTP